MMTTTACPFRFMVFVPTIWRRGNRAVPRLECSTTLLDLLALERLEPFNILVRQFHRIGQRDPRVDVV